MTIRWCDRTIDGHPFVAVETMNRIKRSTILLGLTLSAASCAGAQSSPATSPPAVAAVAPDTLLAMSRIAALPAAERAAWQAYVETSRRNAAADRAFIDAELRAAGLERPTPATAARG